MNVGVSVLSQQGIDGFQIGPVFGEAAKMEFISAGLSLEQRWKRRPIHKHISLNVAPATVAVALRPAGEAFREAFLETVLLDFFAAATGLGISRSTC